MPGSDSFNVPGAKPLAAELSESQPHDNAGPIVYGSAATYANEAAGANTPFATIVAQDPGIHEHPFKSDIAHARGSAAVVGDASQEPLLYGSAASIAGLANRPQYASAQVVKEDPGVSNLPPGKALPYGNNEIGPAAITGDIVYAPAGTGPGFGSGYVSSTQDVDVLGPGAKVTLGAGTNDSILTSQPSAPITGPAQASGTSQLPSQVVDKNAGGGTLPVGSGATLLGATGLAVSTAQPHAPQTQSEPQTEPQKVDAGEGGHQNLLPPTTQYGTSAP